MPYDAILTEQRSNISRANVDIIVGIPTGRSKVYRNILLQITILHQSAASNVVKKNYAKSHRRKQSRSRKVLG